MIFAWKKLGQLYLPENSGRHAKLVSHAANPIPVHLEGDIFRIFYSGRDEKNRSSIGAVDINIQERRVVKEHQHPFFQHGVEGSFYSDGVSCGDCYCVEGKTYMLFMGWQVPIGCHWHGSIGRLILTENFTLELEGQSPFMDVDDVDPISLSYPCVSQNFSGGYDMWYGSTITWEADNGEMLHVINHAYSPDGHHWRRNGLAVPFALGIAQAFSKPTVANNRDGSWGMWFSYRGGAGDKYRIGYAKSLDGISWKLELENAGISVSEDGWDSEMIEYPFVFEHAGQRYMLYNGNGYGKTGFGIAVLEN